MTWNTYLAVMMVFLHNRSTAQLIRTLGVYTDELRQFLDVTEPG